MSKNPQLQEFQNRDQRDSWLMGYMKDMETFKDVTKKKRRIYGKVIPNHSTVCESQSLNSGKVWIKVIGATLNLDWKMKERMGVGWCKKTLKIHICRANYELKCQAALN